MRSVRATFGGFPAATMARYLHYERSRAQVIRRLRRGLEPDSETVLRQQARFGRAFQPSLARLDRVAGTRHATDSRVRARS